MGRDIVKARTTQNGATVAGHTMDIKGFDLNSFLLYFFFLASPPFSAARNLALENLH